jgi:hypothetical protein
MAPENIGWLIMVIGFIALSKSIGKAVGDNKEKIAKGGFSLLRHWLRK